MAVESETKSSGFRKLRYVLVTVAVLALLTYCNMKTMFWSETLNPGQTRHFQLWANTIVFSVPAFNWTKEDQYFVKADVRVKAADVVEKAKLIDAVHIGIKPGEV
jgi:hypothetical protein